MFISKKISLLEFKQSSFFLNFYPILISFIFLNEILYNKTEQQAIRNNPSSDCSYIPPSTINIGKSLNTAFTADKLNAVKTYVDMYTIKVSKHSSLA